MSPWRLHYEARGCKVSDLCLGRISGPWLLYESFHCAFSGVLSVPSAAGDVTGGAGTQLGSHGLCAVSQVNMLGHSYDTRCKFQL